MNESRKTQDGWKICARCETEKLVSAFGRRASSGDGLQYWCRDCIAVQQRTKYSIDRESTRLDRIQARLESYKPLRLEPPPLDVDPKTLALLDEDNPMLIGKDSTDNTEDSALWES